MHLEGFCVGTKKGTEDKTGDTGKTGTGVSGIFRVTSRGEEGHLGRTRVREGHLGATQGDMLEKYQGTRKDIVGDIKGAKRDGRKDIGHGTNEKRGSTGHKSAQQQYPMAKYHYSLFCPFALHQVL